MWPFVLADALLAAAAMRILRLSFFLTLSQTYAGQTRVCFCDVGRKADCRRGFSISSVDVTIVAQRPKLLAFIPQMIENVASESGYHSRCVSRPRPPLPNVLGTKAVAREFRLLL